MQFTTWDECASFGKAWGSSGIEAAEAFGIESPWHTKVNQAMKKGQVRVLRKMITDIPYNSELKEKVIAYVFDYANASKKKPKTKYYDLLDLYLLSKEYPRLNAKIFAAVEKAAIPLFEEAKSKKSLKPLQKLYLHVPSISKLSREILRELISRRK